MKKVITYGTFDMLHIGHLNILKRAKQLGDYLIVGISSDEFNEQKGKETIIPFTQRKELIKSIKYVDEVFIEHNWKQKEIDIKNNKIDVFVMGDDWEGKFDHLKEYCEVIYLPRTKNISTTEIKKTTAKLKELLKELEELS